MGNTGTKDKFQIALDTYGNEGFVNAVWDHIQKPNDYDGLKGVDFDFECLSFEGGGCKGAAYTGAIKVFEDLGLLPKFKRISGASAGAFTALQIVLGYSINDALVQNVIPSFEDQFLDSGKWAMLVNILTTFGWHSGRNLKDNIEKSIERKLGTRRITFRELYEKTGKELCVVTVSLNTRSVMYCHVKTTPDMDVAEAVRTSMALPVMYAPHMEVEHDMNVYSVDGGLLENYPIAVFDGWFLSMKPGDSFFDRLDEDPSTYFAEVNKKSIGMVVFSHGEFQSGRHKFLKRYGDQLLEGRPDSKLSLERAHTRDTQFEMTAGSEALNESASILVRFLVSECKKHQNPDSTHKDNLSITFQQFKEAMMKIKEDPELRRHFGRLMGSEGFIEPLEKSFADADTSKDGRLSMVECLNYLQRRGVHLRHTLEAKYPRKIESFTGFLLSMMDVMMSYITESKQKMHDGDRTIGIYTDYISTADFDISYEDRVYLIQQGYKAALVFLKNKVPGLSAPPPDA